MRLWMVLALLVASNTSVLAQESGGRCFEVFHGEWAPPVEVGEDSIYMGLPSRVRLSTQSAGDRSSDGAAILEVPEGALASVHRIRQWVGRSDSLFMVWSNGFSGVRGSFARSEGVLDGTVESFWDFGRPRQFAEARLVPVSCSAPHDPDRVRQRPLPRFIELDDGRRLELGALVAEVPGLEEGGGRLSRYSRNVEYLGAEVPELRVTPTEDGTVRLLVLSLAPELDEEVFLAGMRDRLGPGVRNDSGGGDRLEHQTVTWRNRNTWYLFSKSRREGDPWSYMLMINDPSMPSF